jgi:purine-binding chemotaxis protein CheW
VLGVLADSVQEVVEMEPEHIEPPPQLGTKLNTEFIKGMGKVENAFVMILDIDKVFSSDELSDIQGIPVSLTTKGRAGVWVSANNQ